MANFLLTPRARAVTAGGQTPFKVALVGAADASVSVRPCPEAESFSLQLIPFVAGHRDSRREWTLSVGVPSGAPMV